MKKILTILFILISVSGYSQSTTPQFIGGKSSNLIVQSVFNMADSPKASFNLILPDTTTAKTYFSGNLKGRWARQNGRLMYNPTGLKFVNADSVTSGGGGSADSATFYTNYRADTSRTNIYAAIASSGGSTDTTSLSTRIDARVKYTDTAAMLSNYLNSGDIGVSVQGYDANTTILGNTTSGSGSTILLQGSPTITLPNIAAINVSGGILTLPTGASGTLMRLADTSTLSDRINSKLNISDTASMLANYYDVRDTGRSNGNVVTGGTLSKVTDSLGALIGGGGVSAASVAEINTGTDNTKFASPLGLEGSEYLDQSGTKVAGTTAGTATAYTLTLTPAITSYTTGLSLWVKFHLANTGAATINVNGLGAKALVKDISTALVANDIPINQWYTLVYNGTNFLIQDIGFGGVNLSARLLGALSDETGTGVSVFGTSPSFTTSVIGGATFSAFNTTTTNLSLGGAATTMTIGGTPTTAITHTYSGNATANTITKTLNFGTGGASGSTTAINIGSATSGATNNIKINVLPASDATGDMYYRNASGFLTRIPIGTTGQALRWNGSAIVWRDTAASGGGGSAGGSSTQMQYNNAGAFGGTSGLTWDNVNSRLKFGGGTKASELSIISSAAFGDGNIYIESSDGSGAAITLNSTSGSGKKYSLFSRPTNTLGIYDYGAGAYVAEFNAPDYQSLRIRGTSVDGAGLALNPTASGGTTWTINSPATGSGLGEGRLVFYNGATRMTLLDNGTLALGTTTPSASAILDLTSTTQGLGLPNLTTTQINAISSPKTGLMVFNTTLGTICFYDGAAWQKVTHTTM